MEMEMEINCSPPGSLPSVPATQKEASMDEEALYPEAMSSPQTPSQCPPVYVLAPEDIESCDTIEACATDGPNEPLPEYSCDIHMESVFQRKMEMENATKKAEDRKWVVNYLVLHGTALHVYQTEKKRHSWKLKTRPNKTPDSPPWLMKSVLEKSYSLCYADVGIAADYRKRRYVIRIRAESDQFLLSCHELETFVKWLDALFAAISVAAPIDEMDFPRDQSIPRVQRARWFRGVDPAYTSTANSPRQQSGVTPGSAPSLPNTSTGGVGGGDDSQNSDVAPPPVLSLQQQPTQTSFRPLRSARLSMSTYPNAAVDAETGKWTPMHKWTQLHDMSYAKLCYAVLLFKSPRKSNYIFMKGKKWVVDWATGKVARVNPPRYGEVEPSNSARAVGTRNSRA